MERFTILIVEIDLETDKEISSDDSLEYDWFAETLLVVQSISAGYWVDENRVRLAKGEPCEYMMPKIKRVITIRENK